MGDTAPAAAARREDRPKPALTVHLRPGDTGYEELAAVARQSNHVVQLSPQRAVSPARQSALARDSDGRGAAGGEGDRAGGGELRGGRDRKVNRSMGHFSEQHFPMPLTKDHIETAMQCRINQGRRAPSSVATSITGMTVLKEKWTRPPPLHQEPIDGVLPQP